MKKLLLTLFTLNAGAMLSYSQGLVALQDTVGGLVYTNGASIGEGTGVVNEGLDSYYYELLDMSQSQWTALSSSQQSAAANLIVNPSAVDLWTDSGIAGSNYKSNPGGIFGLGGAAGTTAANWAAPTGATYASAGSYDYYVIVGWSANEGANWSTIAGEIEGGTLAPGWFGETAIAYNDAGGGDDSLPAMNVWESSAATGLAGSGFNSGDTDLLNLSPIIVSEVPVPEPATLALAGLGGLSMLFLRRKKG